MLDDRDRPDGSPAWSSAGARCLSLGRLSVGPIAAIALLVGSTLSAQAAPARTPAPTERILDYDILFRVLPDGSYQVTEMIRAVADGKQIRSGLFRDYPTVSTEYWVRRRHPFEVLRIERDGRPIATDPWTLDEEGNARAWLGQAGSPVEPGEHEWLIEYRTGDWILDDGSTQTLYTDFVHDWAFPIDALTVEVQLPSGIRPGDLRTEIPSDEPGSDARFDAPIETASGGTSVTLSASGLPPRASISGRISWPSGIVDASRTPWSDLFWSNWSTRGSLLAWTVVVGALLFGFTSRPRRGESVSSALADLESPLAQPPDLSVIEARALHRLASLAGPVDTAGMNAWIAGLEAHGIIELHKEGPGWSIRRLDSEAIDSLPDIDRKALDALFASARTIRLQPRSPAIKRAKKVLRRHLANWSEVVESRSTWWRLAILSGIVGVAFSVLASDMPTQAIFLSIWLLFWSVGATLLTLVAVHYWNSVRLKPTNLVPAIFITLFATPFVGVWFLSLAYLVWLTSPVTGLLIVTALVGALATRRWTKVLTDRGWRLRSELARYRDWLRRELGDRAATIDDELPDDLRLHVPWALALDLDRSLPGQSYNRILDAFGSSSSAGMPWSHGPYSAIQSSGSSFSGSSGGGGSSGSAGGGGGGSSGGGF